MRIIINSIFLKKNFNYYELNYALIMTYLYFKIMKKIISVIFVLMSLSAFGKNTVATQCNSSVRIECHPSLFSYMVHSTFRPDPFRGPGCKSCYRPVLEPWTFAQ